MMSGPCIPNKEWYGDTQIAKQQQSLIESEGKQESSLPKEGRGQGGL
jgi:hypothetical protein